MFKRHNYYSTSLSQGAPLLNKLERAVLIQSAGEFGTFAVYQFYNAVITPMLFSNPPSFDDMPLIYFLAKTTQNLLCGTGPVLYLTTNLTLRKRAFQLAAVRGLWWKPAGSGEGGGGGNAVMAAPGAFSTSIE